MATEQELKQALIKADKAGDTQAAQLFADKINQLRQQETAQAQPEVVTQQPATTEVTPPPTEAIQEKPQPSFIDKQIAGREASLSMATAAIATPFAGVAGIAQSLNPFADEGAGGKAVDATMEFMTYKPRTKLANELLSSAGENLGFIGDVISKKPGDFMFDLAQDPNFQIAARGNPLLTLMAENPAAAGAAGATTIPAILELMGVKGGSKIRTAKQARTVIADEIKAGNRNISNITKVLDSEGKLLSNPALKTSIELLGNSDDARHTAILFDTMNKQTRTQVNKMLDTIQSGRDKGYAEIQRNRPVNVIGDSLAKRIQAADRVRETANKQLNTVINTELKGTAIDIKGPVDRFMSSLDDSGIEVLRDEAGKISVNLDNATVNLGDVLPKSQLEKILRMSEAGTMDAAKAHKFKQYIREFVDYSGGMQVGSKTSKSIDNAIKEFSSGINDSIGKSSPAYLKANAKYASVADSLKAASKQLGDFDMNSDMASAKLGNLSKRIASNLTSKEQVQSLIDGLDNSLNTNGVRFSDDINAQVTAVGQIEKIFNLESKQSPFGLQGRIESAGNVMSGGGMTSEGVKMVFDKLKKMSEKDFNDKMLALRKLSEVKK